MIGRIEFGPHRQQSTGGDLRCCACGEPEHGSIPCPNLRVGSPQPTLGYAPNPIPPWPGAQPVDYGKKLDRIIELLEQLLRGGEK